MRLCEKNGTARQATDGNIIQRMRFTCWIIKATNTHSECVIFIASYSNNSYTDTPQPYIILRLPILLTHLLHGAESFFKS
jgi:formylmethanofuran dehydrogenase subunit E-like metal-binding protein